MDATGHGRTVNAFSCELEDWFHILDSDKVPTIDRWDRLPLHIEENTERLLDLLHETGVLATFFCLGWIAEKVPQLVRRCRTAGHEIASHGYGHVLAYRVGRKAFREDIVRSKEILEDITGEEVAGFRSPGFSVRQDNQWVFDVVAEAGYSYDASVFPTHHGHGGLESAPPHPYFVETSHGMLVEIPTSTVSVLGRRFCLFGGGYLRISPLPLIRWGVRRLHQRGQPLVVYVHPREIDPDHPRLPLAPWRKFKCYTNLHTTLPKLRWLCEHYRFTTMGAVAAAILEKSTYRPLVEQKASKARERILVRAAARAGQRTSPEQIEAIH
jgi:polysaccharide deacetylase family protein (PEP-CTERM system associated)